MYLFDDSIRYILLFTGGIFAGIVKVVAGGGSFITLPILMCLGLSTPIANGTNRISIVLEDISASVKLMKKHPIALKTGITAAIPALIGAIAGASIATHVSEEFLNITIMTILVLMTLFIFFKPPQKKEGPDKKKIVDVKISFLTMLIFAAIGFYSGFIQAGGSLLWIAALTGHLKMDLVEAGALRIFLSSVIIPVTLSIYILHHQVAFLDGTILGIGSFFGAWLGARFIVDVKIRVIRIFMICIYCLAGIYIMLFKVLGLF